MKITYQITPKKVEENNHQYDIHEIVDEIKRDISWGTYSERLSAATKTIGNDNYMNLSPDTNINNQHTDNGFISFEVNFNFKKEQFNFEEEGLNHFIGTIAGDIIRNRKIKELIVKDFEFDNYDFFPGPILGNNELKSKFFSETLDSPRPLIAFSIKPRIGFSIEGYKKIIADASKSNIDIIEDDERLVSPLNCSFSERVQSIQETIKSGTKSKLSINLTSNPHKIDERVAEAYDAGIRVFKLDVMVVGFDTLLHLRTLLNKKDEKCIITVFPDVHGSIYRCLSRNFILKLARLCGADIMYAGSPFPSRMGKLIENNEPLEKWSIEYRTWINECKKIHAILLDNINNAEHIKSCLPTITHDINPQIMETLIHLMKLGINDKMEYAFFIGGGISSFKCNYTIKESCELWLDIAKYSGGFDLSQINITDYNKLERFTKEGYQECLEANGIGVIHNIETIKYKSYD